MRRLFVLVALIFVGCNTNITNKRSMYSTFDAIPEIDAFRIRIMQLPTSEIPSNSISVPIADTTQLAFQWTQAFETMPIIDQPDPSDYGSGSDTTIIMLEPGDWIEDTPAGSYSVIHSLPQIIPFVEGAYQVQVSGCVWSNKEQRRIWSKYSDAFAFFTYLPNDPPAPSINLTITIGN